MKLASFRSAGVLSTDPVRSRRRRKREDFYHESVCLVGSQASQRVSLAGFKHHSMYLRSLMTENTKRQDKAASVRPDGSHKHRRPITAMKIILRRTSASATLACRITTMPGRFGAEGCPAAYILRR